MFLSNKKTNTRRRKTVFRILAAMISRFIPCLLHTSMALKPRYYEAVHNTNTKLRSRNIFVRIIKYEP